MPLPEEQPKVWRELCAELQTEKDPVRFRALVAQVNRLLNAREKANRQERAVSPPPDPPGPSLHSQ
jgi:hypothetical protein